MIRKAVPTQKRIRADGEKVRRTLLANPEKSRKSIARHLAVPVHVVEAQVTALIEAGLLKPRVATPRTDAEIRVAYAEHGSLRAAADALGIHYTAVRARLVAMGVAMRGVGRPKREKSSIVVKET